MVGAVDFEVSGFDDEVEMPAVYSSAELPFLPIFRLRIPSGPYRLCCFNVPVGTPSMAVLTL